MPGEKLPPAPPFAPTRGSVVEAVRHGGPSSERATAEPCSWESWLGTSLLSLWLGVLAVSGPGSLHAAIKLEDTGYHVFPGDEIQDAVEMAATNRIQKTVWVHAGEYRPGSPRQAMIWFNRVHDGVRLLARGPVTLTAVNSHLGAPGDKGYPAAVNHVIYLGDGVTSNTVVEGFRIIGANGFLTRSQTKKFEPNVKLPKNLFFYADGGAIKIFGHSSPVIRRVEIADNFTSPCGAGISIQQMGLRDRPVLIEDCVFVRNRAQVTGAALDLLAGSSAVIRNCLFTANVSNLGEDVVARQSGERPFINSGCITVFQNSKLELIRCTLTGNRNGVDDMGGTSVYRDSIFWDNNLDTGIKGTVRYDLAVNAGANVQGCFIQGTVHDVRKVVSVEANNLRPPPPRFDARFVPADPAYARAGYRPVPFIP